MPKLLKPFLTLFLPLLGIVLPAFSIADSAQDSTVIAALALNFARFTEWPASILKPSDTSIQLCVLGDNVTQQAFSEIDHKPVGNRSLNIVSMSRIKNLGQCHMLYISGIDRSTSIQLLAEVSNQHILTLGEDDDFIRDGGMIHISIPDGKVNILVNLNAVKHAELQISSRVLKLVTIVNP